MIPHFAADDRLDDFEAANLSQPVAVGADIGDERVSMLVDLLDRTEVASACARVGAGVLSVCIPRGSILVIAEGLADMLGGLRVDAPDLLTAAAELAVRGSGRGLKNLSLGFPAFEVSTAVTADAWIMQLHPNLLEVHRDEAMELNANARSVASGLHVLVEASCFADPPAGTRVYAIALIDALGHHPDIERLAVGITQGCAPEVEATLRSKNVEIVTIPNDLDLGDLAPKGFDVIHRPVQPFGPLPYESWRRIAHRVVISVHDLISYDIADYHPSGDRWKWYRDGFGRAVTGADAVAALSADVAANLRRSQLPLESHRIRVVYAGLDHLRGNEPQRRPGRFDAAHAFMLLIGGAFAHKNHDIGVATWRALRSRGYDLDLIVAGLGPTAPPMEGMILLGSVADDERNWLLANAAVVLYPTSAEGFGLVPFEAASFGTATVTVSFGPLSEVAPDIPYRAARWRSHDLVDAVEKALQDPIAQVQAYREAGASLTWQRTAQSMVELYRHALATPSLAVVTTDRLLAAHLDAVTAERVRADREIEALKRSRSYRLASTLRRRRA